MLTVGPSESMSKSKKNTIDPEKMIDIYGADAVRLFILSDSPPEKDVQWSETGMTSAYKFIQKFWLMRSEIIQFFKKKNTMKNEIEFLPIKQLNKINYCIRKI